MANATLRELATYYSLKDTPLIEHLVNESGILKYALAFPSTNGTFHKYSKVSALPTSSYRRLVDHTQCKLLIMRLDR